MTGKKNAYLTLHKIYRKVEKVEVDPKTST